MKLICKCGNIFDFSNSNSGTVEGFEFVLFGDNEDTLAIHCKKCDKAITLSNPEVIDDDKF